MPITLSQKAAIEETIHALLNATSIRSKRPVKLASMFMDLVDRTEWPAYYDVIPEPRCLKNIQAGVEKGRYREASDVYTDLSLVFWNALFYNEPDSQIAMDADFLKTLLEAEWKKRSVLPHLRTSPPPSSPQKVHRIAVESSTASKNGLTSRAMTTPAILPAVPTIPTRTATPAGQIFNTSSTMPIQQHSSDPDVDIVTPDSESPEDEGPAVQTDRDPQSDEIIQQLEKGLPSWPGFGEEGWMDEVKPERFSDIVHAIKSHKDIIGNRLAVCLESIPEESSSTLHLSSTTSISLKQIETRSRHKLYKSAKDFDTDMARIFEKARRWHYPGTEAYGMALLLQRFYQAITSPNPPPGPPYTSPTNFASLPAGPGVVKPFPAASSSSTAATSTTADDEREGSRVSNVTATTYRAPPTRDRTFVEEVNYKGWKIKLGDWVHLSNPDDPSKPVVGQVFKCWMSESDDLVVKKGHHGITVSWYYRPEQTFHPSNRQFWEGEVFKTPHFADHPIEDLIEKVACQFTAQHIRGRPRPPFWYLGFPLYVCDSQYNDLERVFVKITDWNGCVPEEVRPQQQQGEDGEAEEFMPIYPFEKIVWPKRMGSPFLVGRGGGTKGMKGPGGIVNVPAGSGSDQAGGEGDSSGVRKKLRSDGNPGRGQQQQPPHPAIVAVQSQNQYQQFQQPYLQQHQVVNQTQRSTTLGPDRSVVTAAGGIVAIGGPAQVEKLPPETAKLFDRDPVTNEVLWFAAPPLNMSRARGPRYSLEYLTFVATKRKQREASAGTRDVDGEEREKDEWEGSANAKRPRTDVLPTVTETLRDVWKEMRADGYM